MDKKARVIAFYLPQFHPIPENDEWWGKGFTEWTSVGKAKKYYRGHYQPRVPADLGYYDLRMPEVREAQVELAREAGVDGFCYWHYWLGNGKQLLERPLQEVVRIGKPDFPFCLGWANHSWLNKSWNREKQTIIPKLLIEQVYPGREDIEKHFYTMLPTFSDRRYMRIHGKLIFLIYSPLSLPYFDLMREIWNRLASQNGIPDFFFIANVEDISLLDHEEIKKYDAVSLSRLYSAWNIEGNRWRNFYIRVTRNISRIIGRSLNRIDYEDAIKSMDTDVFSGRNIFPNIIPCWDNSPRRGAGAFIYDKSTPELFKVHVCRTLEHIAHKDDEDKIIFLKSWNEWAEGNYMEPDLKWGKGYINALHDALYGK